MEVLRRLIEVHVTDDQTRRDVQCPAQRDAQVREVAANTGALHKHLLRGGGGVAETGLVINRLMQPGFDRTHAAKAVRQVAEELLRHAAHDV